MRLRQTDDFRYVTGTHTVKTVNGSTTFAVVPVSILANGHRQAVYDTGDVKSPYRPWLNATGVPPLKPVQMSKIDSYLISGSRDVNWRVVADGIVANYVGLNLALLPVANGNWFYTHQGLDSSFIYTDPKVNSWLLQRAYSKMGSAEYDFGVSVGEVAETAAMLAGPLGKIASLSSAAFAGARAIYHDGARAYLSVARNATARQLRRLKATTKQHPTRASLRIIDESANHWLAYKFGVLPFIDDVGKMMDFKEKNVAQKFGLQHARVKGPKMDSTVFETVNQYRGLGGGNIILSATQIKRTEDRHYCGLYFRNKCSAPLVNFMESIGFAPWQLPSLAYELIPLSFVVDRFIDIKSFIRGNIGSLSKDTFGSWHTRQLTVTSASTLTDVWFGQVNDRSRVKIGPQRAMLQTQKLARVINWERPNFPVVNPYWRDQLTADATNLSLIWGRLRTHVGRLTQE